MSTGCIFLTFQLRRTKSWVQTQEGEITTPKTLAPGKEVKVWELPPLTDNPVTPEPLKGGQNIDPNLGMDASQKPDEPSLTPQKSQERESELASHPLRDSDSFTSDSMSRAGSPQLEVNFSCRILGQKQRTYSHLPMLGFLNLSLVEVLACLQASQYQQTG